MKRPFKEGDKVRTGYWEREDHIVRKVLDCVLDGDGLWKVVADGGERCDCCTYKGRPTPPLSLAWFSEVEGAVKDGD